MTQTAESTKEKGNADSLFDLDDMLGDVLEAPTTGVEPAAETLKETPTTIAGEPTTIYRRRTRSSPNTLYFDLETIPDYSREELFGLDPIPSPAVYMVENDSPAPSVLIRGTEEEVKAAITKAQAGGKMLPKIILEAAMSLEAKSEKKPRKGVMSLLGDMIRAIDNEAVNIQAAKDNRRKTMSCTPEMCRIVSFGWAMGDEVVEASVFGAKGCTPDFDTYERAVLKKFWELAKRAKVIVGFNHVGFDLPIIYTRSALLGVEPTKMIDTKPWGGEVVDVMTARWPKGGQKKLKDYARMLGFTIPAGDVDGSQVEELQKTNPAKLGDYNRSDVSITREVYLMGRGLFWA